MTTIRPPEGVLTVVALQPTTFAWVHQRLLYADALRPVPSAWARYAPAMDALADRLTRGDMRPAPVTVLGDLAPEVAQEGLRRLATSRTRGKLVMRVTA